MKNKLKIALISALFFCSFFPNIKAAGLQDVVINDLSSSQNSFSLDYGTLDKYSEGIYAKFFIQTQGYQYPKIFLVAEGKLVKSFPRKSYWYLKKIYLPRFVVNQTHLLMLTSTDVRSGRDFVAKKKHILIPSREYESAEDFNEKNKNMVPDRLNLSGKDYEKSGNLFETNKILESDLEVEIVQGYKKKSGYHLSDEYNDQSEEKYFINDKEVELADLRLDEDKKLLDAMTEDLVNKINSQKVKLSNGIYREQEKDEREKEINKKISIVSVYDSIREEKKEKEQISPYALAKIKRDEDLWSADMEDKDLRRYFITSGIEKEKRRRDIALNELDGNEIMFHYAGALISHGQSYDQNYQNLGFSLGLAYDFHLSRATSNIKDWSIEFLLETGKGDYDIGSLNARFTENYLGIYANYYFYNNPLTLNSLIILGGLGLKAGSASASAIDLTKEYSYQVLTLPALQLISKYRFRSGDTKEETLNVGLSLNAGISLDFKRMSVLDSINKDDMINGKINYSDLKYLIGMSLYF